MIWVFFTLVAVLIGLGFAALITGRLTYDPLPEPTHTEHDVAAARIRRAADVDSVYFDTALRGYRMDQVDDVLDALRARLAVYESGEAATMKLPRVSGGAAPRSGVSSGEAQSAAAQRSAGVKPLAAPRETASPHQRPAPPARPGDAERAGASSEPPADPAAAGPVAETPSAADRPEPGSGAPGSRETP